jgi:metal-responsive CopG/Arc/MetJ family transcriptional regulator
MSTDSKSKKIRVTISIDESVANKIDEASKTYGIPKTYYMVLATLEKIKREEENEINSDK